MIVNSADEFASILELADRCLEYCVRSEHDSVRIDRGCDRSQIERWKYLLRVPEIDDRDYPEFPLFNPRWPATHTKAITIGGRTILLKDESECPTGTFKARAAHEIVLRTYKGLIRAADEKGEPIEPPVFSLISAGSMAVALQHLCIQLRLPDVRALMDSDPTRHDPDIVSLLRSLGARVYTQDLSQKQLSDNEVCELTDNTNGIDVTTRSLDQILKNQYYDWLCHEILDHKPRHIFVPFGSGDLFANLIAVIRNLRMGILDRRFVGKSVDLQDINVYGATTFERLTRMTKLYADFRPALPEIETLLQECKHEGVLGTQSGIYSVDDHSADAALSELKWASRHIQTELSAVSGLALFLDRLQLIPADETVLVVNTGRVYFPKTLN